MQDKIKQYIKEWKMIKQGDKVIIGVSGGADSVCLLALLNLWKQELHFDIIAVHVHHGLREGAADKDEQYVRMLCERFAVPLFVYHKNIKEESKKRNCSIEEAGREVRHALFKEIKQKQQGTKIALAHHKNDNAETLLMNLARGTGIRGLKGILPVNGDIVRPLLCVERLEIEQYLEEQNIPYQTDETNNSNVYMRNRIRNELIPCMQQNINAKVVEHMYTASTQLQQIEEYLQQEVQIYFDKSIHHEASALILKIADFYEIPKVLRSFVIQKALEQIAGKRKDIFQIHIRDVERLFTNQVSRRIDLPYDLQAVRCYEGVRLEQKGKVVHASLPQYNLFDATKICIGDTLVCHRIFQKQMRMQNTADVLQNVQADIAGKRYTKQFDYDIINASVVVRTRKSGDYIIMNEQGDRQKIKDYFINQKIPREKRDTILLIAEGNHILWIVGYRSSLAYKVSEHTSEILEIEIRPNTEETK